MRTATILAWGQIDWWPENLFSGCCPCICLTLKLLSQLWLVVRDCVFISFPSLKRVWKRREGALVCVDTHVYVSLCHVGSYQSALGYLCLFGCVSVCLRDREKEERERERRRDPMCQSILALENSRSSFHVLPTIGQSVSNQSGA